jgi:uncharacterized protein
MNVIPVPCEPILLLEPDGKQDPKGKKVLVVADLHLGLEASLRKVGMHLPSQTNIRTRHILDVLGRTGAKRLVLLGDVKHTIGGFSRQEEEELPRFFKELLSKVKSIDIVVGNHDGGLKDALPDGIKLHQHLVIGDVGLTHGHSWPPEDVMACQHVVMGHDHPTVLFLDELGQRHFYPCWVKGRLVPSRAEGRYKGIRSGGTGLVMPAFDDLGSGTPVNLQKVKLLGPLLSNGVIDLATATIHLVDGTFLGDLKDLTVTDTALLREQEEVGPAGPLMETLGDDVPASSPSKDDGGSEE